ncbi:MAG: hypothetical protein MUE74_00070 [Bacteroidales bacterium]|nr:hypothetical protein [Bacteroidales bacterium]
MREDNLMKPGVFSWQAETKSERITNKIADFFMCKMIMIVTVCLRRFLIPSPRDSGMTVFLRSRRRRENGGIPPFSLLLIYKNYLSF